MSSAHLPRSLITRILRHTQQSPDEEVCGLIAARDGVPRRCIPIHNVAAAPHRLFLMEPKQQIAALREIRERGETLFAIYHSHPDSPPLPSPTDLSEAAYPEALYLIISLGTRGVLEMRGYRLTGAELESVDLVLGS